MRTDKLAMAYQAALHPAAILIRVRRQPDKMAGEGVWKSQDSVCC